MSLSETTRSVLRLVEERSGIPVHVEPDPNLPGTILAKVVMARENLLLHRVFYRPNSTTPPDYLICQQAGFILRFFAVRPTGGLTLRPPMPERKPSRNWLRRIPWRRCSRLRRCRS